MRHMRQAGLAISCFLALATSAKAQSLADFYTGKNVTMVIGLSPGGGYDTFGRAVARFIGNHIPGRPNVIVQNMPGAGSLTAVLYLDNAAPKDGTVITTFNPGIITDAITDPARAKKKFTDLGWIGSATDSFRMCYFTEKSGIRTYDDLKRDKTVNVGGGGGIATAAFNDVGILKNLMKLNVRPVVGYPGRAEVHLAMERGELDGECGTIEGIPDDWIRDKKVHVVAKTAPGEGVGIPEDTPWLGKFLTSKDDIDVLNFLTLTNKLGRPYVTSKQIPADRLAALRTAFDATMKDTEFLAAADKQRLNINPATGIEAEKIIEQIYAVPARISDRARDVIK